MCCLEILISFKSYTMRTLDLPVVKSVSVVLLSLQLLACLAHDMESTSESNLNTTDKCTNHSWLIETSCQCGDSLDGAVYCNPSKEVFVKSQFCMTIHEELGEEVVGRCPYTFLQINKPNVTNIGLYYMVPTETKYLEQSLCDSLNRQGLLCGKCKEGYGYSMYPDFISCVECHPEDFARNWVLYVIISFGPLTLFLILIICLRINAASAPLNAFVFVSQVFTQPPFARGFINTINDSFISDDAKGLMRFLYSLYGIWNLDFFLAMIPPFCLPHQNVFSVIAITYAIAFYPLVVLAILYLVIELYSRDVKFLVWLWKPFLSCYVRCRRHWDIRASVIDAFATFLLLSYVKILFVSIDVLAPAKLMLKNGTSIGLVSYFDASFSVSAMPITVVTYVGILLMLFLVIILPVILLLLYPCRFCQNCLTRTKLHSRTLHFLMSSFNGCYKDSTTSVIDRRFFAAVFLVFRIVTSIDYIALYFNYFTAVAITCTALAITIAVLQPYRNQYSRYNRLDPLMIFFLVVWLIAFKDIRLAARERVSHQKFWISLCYISLVLPMALVILYFVKFSALKKCWYRCWKRNSSSLEESIVQRSHIPYEPQLDNSKELGTEYELSTLDS